MDELIDKLSTVAYQMALPGIEDATDTTSMSFHLDHPAVLGALGMMQRIEAGARETMHHTLDWIWDNWTGTKHGDGTTRLPP